jgi:hypothetical protein
MTLLQLDNIIAALKQHNAYDPNMKLETAMALVKRIRVKEWRETAAKAGNAVST